MYMYTNVSCDHCQNFWKDIRGAVKSGKLQVRLVPSGGYIENREGGAALLSVADPAQAWDNYIGGTVTALSKTLAKPGTLENVDANTEILKNWNVEHMPFTIYRRLEDGVVMAIMGRPENTMLIMADLMKN